MLFDLSNYWIFVVLLAAVYFAASTYAQNNVGGKGRLKAIQVELKEVQKRMTDNAKLKNDKETNEAIDQNWKLAMEMMVIQFKMLAVLMVIFLLANQIFSYVEAGREDDIRLAMFDDGLAAHCDAAAGDGIFSNCYAITSAGKKGAWVVDGYLHSAANETLARNSTGIYIDGGEDWQILLQSSSQAGWWDALSGKVPHHVNITTDRKNYTQGETVQIHAYAYTISEGKEVVQKDLQGGKMEAVLDAGTFFYYDPPIPIPLINVRRIIGSSGFFIFSAFMLSIAYSIGKAVYAELLKLKK